MTIRTERPGDEAAIGTLTSAAFRLASHASGTEAAIVDALRRAGALTLSLVFEEGGAVVGHVAFSPAVVGDAAKGWFALGPIAVVPDRQGEGIGSTLVKEGLDRLRRDGAAGVVLIGDPAYYGRFGFVAGPALTYRDVPPGIVQGIAFGPVAAIGEIAFHPAFDTAA